MNELMIQKIQRPTLKIGMCVELYGFVVLFSGFFPVAINFLRRIPVIGTVLSMPPIGTYLDSMAGDQYKQMI